MKLRFDKYFNLPSRLRFRAILFAYLSLLIIIVVFVSLPKAPINADPVFSLTASIKEQEYQSNMNVILLLDLLKQNPEVYKDLKFKILETDKAYTRIQQYISKLQHFIDDKASPPRSVFHRNKKSLWNDEEIIPKNQADSLFILLGFYKSHLNKLTNYTAGSRLEQILPLKDYLKDHRNKWLSASRFYFSRRSGEEIRLNLAYFAHASSRLRSFALNKMIQQALFQHGDMELIELFKSVEDLNLSGYLNKKSHSLPLIYSPDSLN